MAPLSEEHGASPVSDKRPSRRGFLKKTIAGFAAAATLAGGMVVGSTTAVAADHVGPTTSYDRTLGNAQFEAARKQYGLAREMSYGSILHAWMWSFNTIRGCLLPLMVVIPRKRMVVPAPRLPELGTMSRPAI